MSVALARGMVCLEVVQMALYGEASILTIVPAEKQTNERGVVWMYEPEAKTK